MLTIGNVEIENAILLAPMEDVTDVSFRLVCKELGADLVYTEFVNSEGLIRANEKTHKKLKIIEKKRPKNSVRNAYRKSVRSRHTRLEALKNVYIQLSRHPQSVPNMSSHVHAHTHTEQ